MGPKGSWMRPTSDRVKEFIFSYLTFKIKENPSVLDLFAGTGALGIEAASRGSTTVIFVDNSKKSIELVKKNLEKVKLAPLQKAQNPIRSQDVFTERLTNFQSLESFNNNTPGAEFVFAEEPKFKSEILQMDVFKFIDYARRNNEYFDLVLCDPPYNFQKSDLLIKKICDSKLINPDGWLVYEHGVKEPLIPVNDLVIHEVRRLGDTAITFIKNEKKL